MEVFWEWLERTWDCSQVWHWVASLVSLLWFCDDHVMWICHRLDVRLTQGLLTMFGSTPCILVSFPFLVCPNFTVLISTNSLTRNDWWCAQKAKIKQNYNSIPSCNGNQVIGYYKQCVPHLSMWNSEITDSVLSVPLCVCLKCFPAWTVWPTTFIFVHCQPIVVVCVFVISGF